MHFEGIRAASHGDMTSREHINGINDAVAYIRPLSDRRRFNLHLLDCSQSFRSLFQPSPLWGPATERNAQDKDSVSTAVVNPAYDNSLDKA